MNSEEHLEAIKARVAKVTPGPWTDPFVPGNKDDGYYDLNDSMVLGVTEFGVQNLLVVSEHTSAFVANAPTDITFLLGLLDQMREAYDERCMLSSEYIAEIAGLKAEVRVLKGLGVPK